MATITNQNEAIEFQKQRVKIVVLRKILFIVLHILFATTTIIFFVNLGLIFKNNAIEITDIIMFIVYLFVIFLYAYQLYWELHKNSKYQHYINKKDFKQFTPTWRYHGNRVHKHFQFMLLVTAIVGMSLMALAFTLTLL